MSGLERFGVSMDEALLHRFDDLLAQRGYASRSEAIRDLVRQALIDEEWTDPQAEVTGTLTLVYEHHAHELAHLLAEFQHQYHEAIICSTHVHMDEHNCLEVIIVRGTSSKVKKIALQMISTRGIKHGQLVSTTTGQHVK